MKPIIDRSVRLLLALGLSITMITLSVLIAPPSRAAENCTRYADRLVCGAIRQKYIELGGPSGFLGLPLTDETSTPVKPGRFNHFQGGSIYWSTRTGAHSVLGSIRQKWAQMGWENGFLGFPLTDELPTPRRTGRFNHFEGGSVYWSPRTPASAVYGRIRDSWAASGWENGPWGFPTSDEFGIRGGRRSAFENACQVTWTGRGISGKCPARRALPTGMAVFTDDENAKIPKGITDGSLYLAGACGVTFVQNFTGVIKKVQQVRAAASKVKAVLGVARKTWKAGKKASRPCMAWYRMISAADAGYDALLAGAPTFWTHHGSREKRRWKPDQCTDVFGVGTRPVAMRVFSAVYDC